MDNIYCNSFHPITCLNPVRYFKVKEWKAEGGRLLVKGQDTCWFVAASCEFYPEETALELIKELENAV